MTRRKRIAAVAAILITADLTVLAQAAAPTPSPTPSPEVTVDPAAMERQLRAGPVLEMVDNIAHGRGIAADVAYAVHMYDQKTGGVVVWRVGGASDAGAARYTALATADIPVTVRDALVSEKDLMSVGQKISDDRAWWTAEGIKFASAGMEQEGLVGGTRLTPGRIYIGVEGLTPEIEEKMLQRYADTTLGRDKVIVIPHLRVTPFVGGRQNDGPPWYGGGRTYTGTYGTTAGCTSGFGVENYTGGCSPHCTASRPTTP